MLCYGIHFSALFQKIYILRNSNISTSVQNVRMHGTCISSRSRESDPLFLHNEHADDVKSIVCFAGISCFVSLS